MAEDHGPRNPPMQQARDLVIACDKMLVEMPSSIQALSFGMRATAIRVDLDESLAILVVTRGDVETRSFELDGITLEYLAQECAPPPPTST